MLRRIVTFRQGIEREDEIRAVPSRKAHVLTGDRKGTWDLFVTKNWRLNFRNDHAASEIIDLDDEDYHSEVVMSRLQGIRVKSRVHPGGFIEE